MARNRQRAKERRSRRSESPVPPGIPGVTGAQPRVETDETGSPSPLEHATPDVELANEQLEVGRPDYAGETEQELEAELELEADAAADAAEADASGMDPDVEEQTHAVVPAEKPGIARRAINFAQGSWRELQRVQWPDRRQVMQATGVVIGFVIVAGVYLGVADYLAGKLMNFILK
jgi:preprotein translocase SecE subunit